MSLIGIRVVVGGVLFSLAIAGAAVAQNPVPIINQPLVPDAVTPGGTGFTLKLSGTGFVPGSVMNWNGSPRATTFVSSSEVTAVILASDIKRAGTVAVTVVNRSPGGGVSNTVFLPIALSTSIAMRESNYGAGNAGLGVNTADLNLDGNLDLVVSNSSDNTISVLLGNGDGTFRSQVTYAVGESPTEIRIADFDGDGKLDLAVTNSVSNTVSVLLGNGDGTFQSQVQYPTGTGSYGLAAADLNADGKLDLVVTNYFANTVSVLLGNGDGTFQAHVDYAVGPVPSSVAVGDFNRDGKLDLAVTNLSSVDTVTVLLGNGDGTFSTGNSYSAGFQPRYVTAADLNGDGKLDLAVANQGDGTISILLGNGDGTFKTQVRYATTSRPTSVIAADLNGDGKLDLATADNNSVGTVSILLGNGDGSFQPHKAFSAGPSANGVAVGDFDRNGILDLAVANQGSNQVSILLQDGTVFLSPSNLNFAGQVLGTTSTAKTVTFTNVGTATVAINSIAIAGTNAADFAETNTCGSSLAPKGHCTISVTFAPDQLGPRAAALTFTDSAPGSPRSVLLGGFGVTSGANATLSATKLTFSTQLVGTSSPTQSITLSNFGTQALSINNIVAHGDFIQSHTCGSTLATLASCTIVVVFKPTQKGSRTGTLSITDNGPNSPQTVNLKGTATVVKLNPTGLAFGVHRVGTTSSQSTTLTNVGSTALSIAGIAIGGTDADEFSQTNTCASSVAAGKSCTITVTFKPSEKGGDSAAVAISDDGGGSPQTVSLSGTGCVIVNGRCKAALTRAMQSALAGSRTAAAPAPTGSSKIGTRILNFVDATRNDPFMNNGDKRELLVRFWYPASVEDTCKLAEYASPKVWSYFAELVRLPLPDVSTHACLDAPVANSAHPVVVFTHGYTGTFTDYTFLFEDLASRGYVVASIDHTHEATAVEFPDGRLAKSLVGSHLNNSWRMDENTLSLVMSTRLKDISFVVNELERLNTTLGNPFTGKLDTSRLALMGHSLGGEATIAGLQKEPRFRAGVILDGVLADTSAVKTEQALLILAAGRKHWSKQECNLWTTLKGPRLAVNLRGSEHLSLSDAVWLARGAFETGTIGPDKTLAAVRDYVSAFLDQNLRSGPANRLLAGTSAEYPDAEVITQGEALCREP